MNTCLTCSTETSNPKFCSRSCSARTNNALAPKRIRTSPRSVLCLGCGTAVDTVDFPRKKYCNRGCEKTYKYRRYIERWLIGKESGLISKGYELSPYVKRYVRSLTNEACSKCGWKEINLATGRIPTQIDHIDGDWGNNVPGNLRLLCPNCHSLTPTWGNRGTIKGRPRYDTKTNSYSETNITHPSEG